jgi:tetratricopeptide (TPR) repeat protein
MSAPTLARPAFAAASPHAAIPEARAQFVAGNFATALQIASDVLKKDPRSFNARILLGELALAKGGGSVAEKMFREAHALRPQDSTAECWLAEALFAQGKLKEAADVLVPLVRQRSRDSFAPVVLAKVAERSGNFAAAEAAFRLALEDKPNEVARLIALTEFLRRRGRLNDAAELVERRLKAQPNDLSALIELSKLRLDQKDVAAAKQLLRQALHQDSKSSEAAGLLGDILKRECRLDEALIMHRRSVGCIEDNLPSVPRIGRKVLFIAQTPSSWQSLASVYDAFAADPNWEVTVVGVPFLHCHFSTVEEQNAIFGFLRARNIPHVRWNEFELTSGCADVAFFYIPYEETLPRGWKIADFLRVVPRLVYVPYAFVTGAGDENARGQFNLFLQQRAWLIFAPGGQNKALFARYCATGDAHVIVTGLPKIDPLIEPDKLRDAEFERFAAGRKIVFWNPHFDIRPDGTPFGRGYSTFLRWQDFLLQEFARRPRTAFVIRPHPLFLSSIVKRGIWNEDDVSRFLKRVNEAGNVLIDSRPDYLAVFASSAAMISDASSLLMEFASMGKPLLYLRNPTGPGLNETEAFVRDYCATAEAEEEIVHFLDEIASESDPRTEARREACSVFIHTPPQGAGRAIKGAVEERLLTESTVTPGRGDVVTEVSLQCSIV